MMILENLFNGKKKKLGRPAKYGSPVRKTTISFEPDVWKWIEKNKKENRSGLINSILKKQM